MTLIRCHGCRWWQPLLDRPGQPDGEARATVNWGHCHLEPAAHKTSRDYFCSHAEGQADAGDDTPAAEPFRTCEHFGCLAPSEMRQSGDVVFFACDEHVWLIHRERTRQPVAQVAGEPTASDLAELGQPKPPAPAAKKAAAKKQAPRPKGKGGRR